MVNNMTISTLSNIATDDYRSLVASLGIKHRAKEARRRLMRAGPEATSELRRGLKDADPEVRIGCCIVLDHHLDEDAVPELIDNLNHAHPEVRAWSLHALACDRCKEGACRPEEQRILPLVIHILATDPAPKVREMAVGLLGPAVHRSDAACEALRRAHTDDPNPVVRKIAGWYVPGGPRYQRLKPRNLSRETRA
jgi:HEAT repeat protein